MLSADVARWITSDTEYTTGMERRLVVVRRAKTVEIGIAGKVDRWDNMFTITQSERRECVVAVRRTKVTFWK
jgi:RNase P/RNase MRP subunit p29